MVRHHSHSIEFKRQLAREFPGETLHTLAKRHDISRNLIRIWVKKLEAGAFDDPSGRSCSGVIAGRILGPGSLGFRCSEPRLVQIFDVSAFLLMRLH
jgi:transposase-like protein